MMAIEVSFEPRDVFDNRIKELYKNVVFLDDLIIYSSGEQKDNLLFNKEKLHDVEALILTPERSSRLNAHVFEIIPSLFEENLKKYNIHINNPTDVLLRSMEPIKDILYKDPFHFDNITENKIIKLLEVFNNDDKIIGQEVAKKSILRSLVKMQWRKNNKKPLVLMFYGKPGIGKTETAKFLAEKLYNGEIIREQMSMASTGNSIEYFKSTKHNETSFSKKLMNRTSNLILLDEFALAHPVILTAFFQLFDEGIYTDSNYTVDMKNSIIVCTSNLLSVSEIYQDIDEALLSRFDAFIPFVPFSEEEKRNIILKIVDEVKNDITKKYKEKIEWDTIELEIILKLKNLTNMRNIRSYIEDYVADKILNLYIENKKKEEIK